MFLKLMMLVGFVVLAYGIATNQVGGMVVGIALMLLAGLTMWRTR